MNSTQAHDVAVIGGGPAGLTAAIALASNGCNTALAAPPYRVNPARPDTRTTALLRASVQLLENIGAWEGCRQHAEPLTAIRIIDDTGRLLQAPEVSFDCKEIDGKPFGYNIPNAELVAVLQAHAQTLQALAMVETAAVTDLVQGDRRIGITLKEGGALSARLVAGADGRNSLCRGKANIGTSSWTYPQVALACNFEHGLAHEGTSYEFHREAGPFTTVPLPGNASSLVWVETHERAEQLMALDDEAIAREIETNLHGILGTISGVGPRASFPLSGLRASRYARQRIALIGEAAHVIPPIGAQGLNLGFRDAATLAEIAGNACAANEDPGADTAMRTYDKARRADILTRTYAVDLLNRSLISGFLPLQAARGLGMHLLDNIPPLKKFFMRQGMSPQIALPRLMREGEKAATAQ